MNLNIWFIAPGVLGLLISVISLSRLIIAAAQRKPVKKWTIAFVTGIFLLAGGIGGNVISLWQSKEPLNQVYTNPAYGISFKYPDGWGQFQDSLNPVLPELPIGTTLSIYLPGDGAGNSFDLGNLGDSVNVAAPPGQNTIGVFINTGNATIPNWTALTVGIYGIDSPGTKDCIWVADNKTLIFAAAPPPLSRAVRVDYAVTGWSALVGFVSPDAGSFFLVSISRLESDQPFSTWVQTWENSPQKNEGKPPYFEKFISSGIAQLAGLSGREKVYTDTQLGGRECKDFAVPANGWVYEVLTSTVKPVKYSDRQPTIKAILASVNITAPVPFR